MQATHRMQCMGSVKVRIVIVFCALLLSATACTIDQCQADNCDPMTPDNTSAKTPASTPAVDAEPVQAIAYDGQAVTATVISTGCTSAEDFEIRHEVHDASCYLTLVRNKPDYCRRAPFVMDITVPWTPSADCDALPVVFSNEITDIDPDKTTPALQRKANSD